MLSQLRLAASLGLAIVLGCSLPAAADGKLKVVASFSIIGDFAGNVGGDRIELTTLVGPDSDAHVFAPRPADAALVSAADVILVNGLHFEGFLTRLVKTSATKAPVVELTNGVQPLAMAEDREHEFAAEEHSGEHSHHSHEHDADTGNVDPHAFQSIANARIYVNNIADAFCAADTAGCGTYRANAAAYDAKLAETDKAVRAEIAAIPEDKRVVIASHDAFGYFSRDYGIIFRAPEGISTEAEASAADVAALIRQVREEKASAIFIENITDPRLVEQISRETGLPVGGTLYSDALSAPDGPAPTYIDLMIHNARAIRAAIVSG